MGASTQGPEHPRRRGAVLGTLGHAGDRERHREHRALPQLRGALCAATVEVSDNAAANLLMRELGGPSSVTAFARTLGDSVTRLDRVEPALNEAAPGDLRDTTTPEAMLADLKALPLGPTLRTASRARLEGWMVACKTGGTVNDVAVLRPPHRAPILVTAYFTGSSASVEERDAVLAEVGRIVVAAFGSRSAPKVREATCPASNLAALENGRRPVLWSGAALSRKGVPSLADDGTRTR